MEEFYEKQCAEIIRFTPSTTSGEAASAAQSEKNYAGNFIGRRWDRCSVPIDWMDWTANKTCAVFSISSRTAQIRNNCATDGIARAIKPAGSEASMTTSVPIIITTPTKNTSNQMARVMTRLLGSRGITSGAGGSTPSAS